MPSSEVHSTRCLFFSLMLSCGKRRRSTGRKRAATDEKALKGVATRRNEVGRVDCLFLRSGRRQASEMIGR